VAVERRERWQRRGVSVPPVLPFRFLVKSTFRVLEEYYGLEKYFGFQNQGFGCKKKLCNFNNCSIIVTSVAIL
jgi:hypothetical protein